MGKESMKGGKSSEESIAIKDVKRRGRERK